MTADTVHHIAHLRCKLSARLNELKKYTKRTVNQINAHVEQFNSVPDDFRAHIVRRLNRIKTDYAEKRFHIYNLATAKNRAKCCAVGALTVISHRL